MLKSYLDLGEFIESMCSSVYDYVSRLYVDKEDLGIDKTWISEQILLLLIKWATGITPAIIIQDVLLKVADKKSFSEKKTSQVSHVPAIHGTISSIGLYKGRESAILDISQKNTNSRLRHSVHSSILSFIPQIIRIGTQIHIANAKFFDEIILPTQLLMIDLEKTRCDVDFVIQSTKSSSLKRVIQNQEVPNALLLKILVANERGILVTDKSVDQPFELYLDKERENMKLLLRFDDTIVLYKPDIKMLIPDTYSLLYGPNTVIFRVPVHSDSGYSQYSQKDGARTEHGLLIRNTSSSASIKGIVIDVKHTIQHQSIVSTTISIIEEPGKIHKICAFYNDVEISQINVLESIKNNHFLWIFGLLKESGGAYYFIKETTVFNTSLLLCIASSYLIPMIPLKCITGYVSFLTRSVILSPRCEEKTIHKICGSVLSPNGKCMYCDGHISPEEKAEELVIHFNLDDGTCPSIECVVLKSQFPFWSTNVTQWNKADQNQKIALLNQLKGKEYIFSLSMSNENEFGDFIDSTVWRVDMCLDPVGYAFKLSNDMMNWHNDMDKMEKNL